MNLNINDIVIMKKQHPCGTNKWQIIGIGSSVMLKCTGCGHTITLSHEAALKAIKAPYQ